MKHEYTTCDICGKKEKTRTEKWMLDGVKLESGSRHMHKRVAITINLKFQEGGEYHSTERAADVCNACWKTVIKEIGKQMICPE